MFALVQKVEEKYKKPKVVDVKSGDTVRVHQKIQEGNKTRVQVFEGLVIRTSNMNSLNAFILVRRIASGVGVEKGYMLHSPNIEKVEVVKRAKVRRNYLSYMRRRGGKSARLASVDFDKDKVNEVNQKAPEVPVDTSKEAKEAAAALSEESKPAEQPKDVPPTTEEATGENSSAEKEATTDETKPKEETESTPDDKAKVKKEKAEAFRKAQEEKAKK